MLSELAPCCPKQVDHKVILQKWAAVKDNLKTDKGNFIPSFILLLSLTGCTLEDEIAHAVRVLRIVESVADLIPVSTATSIAGTKRILYEKMAGEKISNQFTEDIYKRLCAFSYSPALVHSFISLLGPMASHNNSLKNWPASLVTKCDDALSTYMVPQVHFYHFIPFLSSFSFS